MDFSGIFATLTTALKQHPILTVAAIVIAVVLLYVFLSTGSNWAWSALQMAGIVLIIILLVLVIYLINQQFGIGDEIVAWLKEALPVPGES